jgi:arsenate reductase
MAEGWVNHRLGQRWEAHSAGTRPAASVHPLAVKAMAEAGVDISSAVPKGVERFLDQKWDLVVTVCDAAQEACPAFPRPVPMIHVSFPDPYFAPGGEEERLREFRRVRDDIRDRLLPEIERRG